MKCEFARSKVSHSHFWSVLSEQFSKLLQIMFFLKLDGRVAEAISKMSCIDCVAAGCYSEGAEC